jgi:hypothetical protein
MSSTNTFIVPKLELGLIVNIIKFKTYFETETKTFSCSNITDAKKKLIKYLASIFQHLIIDFPDDILEFEYIWFQQQFVKSSVFNYKIFYNNKWIEPWENQHIYDCVLDMINKIDIENNINYEELYDEPTLEELDELTEKNKGFYSNDGYNIDDEEINTYMDKEYNEIII